MRLLRSIAGFFRRRALVWATALSVGLLVGACGSDSLGRLLTIVRVEERLPNGQVTAVAGATVVHKIRHQSLRLLPDLQQTDTTDADGLSALLREVPGEHNPAELSTLLVDVTHPDGRTASGGRQIEPGFDFGNWFTAFWPAPMDARSVIDLVCGTIVGLPTCDPGKLLSTNFVLWGAGVRIVFTPVPTPTPTPTPTPRPPTSTPTPTPEPPTPTPTPTPVPPTSTPTPTPSGRTQLISASIREISGCDVRVGAEAKAKDDQAKRITRMVIEIDGSSVYDSGPVNLAGLQVIVDARAPTGRHTYAVRVWDNADFRVRPLVQDGTFNTNCTGVTALVVDNIDETSTDPANRAPEVSGLQAELIPTNTFYTVEATDPEGDALTYTWTISQEACGTFSGDGPRAVWAHPHPGPGRIACGDDVSHPGTITVVVSDGRGNEITRTYQGSVSGTGPR